MSSDILVIVRQGPYGGFQAAEAVRHVNASLSLGFRPIVVLVDDGVYLAKANQDPGESEWLSLSDTFEEVINRALYEKRDSPAEFYVEEESLSKRGLNMEDLIEGLEAIDNAKIAALAVANRVQMIF